MLYETRLTAELADRYRAAGWWTDRLLNDAVAAAVALHPDRTALVDARRRMTYSEMQACANRCAVGLLDLGVRRGDAGLVQLPYWSVFFVAILDLALIGNDIHPVATMYPARTPYATPWV